MALLFNFYSLETSQKNEKALSGSFPNFCSYFYTTSGQTQTGATIPSSYTKLNQSCVINFQLSPVAD
jgi:hypothetical protein